MISIFVTVLLMLVMVLPVAATVNPASVTAELPPGGSMSVTKNVTTGPIPPVVDVALLEDETGSFGDDIAHLQGGTTASDIYDAIQGVADAQFAVSGFRDYDQNPYGSPGDWVYSALSGMSPSKTVWLGGIGGLTAGGGNDTPEAQYDAIVTAANGISWRTGAQRVLVVTTDAPFHLPGAGKPHVNTHASTVTALNAKNIIVIGLKAPGAGTELDNLASATGGSVQALSSNGANIASAILAGLAQLTTDVWWNVTSISPGLNVSLSPAVYNNVPGNTTKSFTESISVDSNAPECSTLTATVTFYSNTHPKVDGRDVIGTQTISITVKDKTPPEVNAGPDVIVEQSGLEGAPADLPTPIVNDNCDPNPTVIVTGALAIYPLGDTTITVMATDASGNSASDTLVVHVGDNTPPEVDAGPDITVEQTSIEGAPADVPPPIVKDICDPDPDVVIDGLMDIYPLGNNTITVTATDDSRNSATDTLVVHVIDTTAPDIEAGPDITVEQTSIDGAPADIPPPVVDDICDPDPSVVFDGLMDIYPLGDTTITTTATDDSGNSAMDTLVVHVIDTTAPLVWAIEAVNPHGKTIPPAGSTTLPGPKGGKNDDGFYKLLTDDICDAEPEIYIAGFGPVPIGTVVKVTEAKGATLSFKKMGSSNGQAGAVSYHIITPTDLVITAIDDSGNIGTGILLVPPPPK
ncbi:hypothetical protein ACFLWL_00880 [Chloroflexota bacterium]